MRLWLSSFFLSIFLLECPLLGNAGECHKFTVLQNKTFMSHNNFAYASWTNAYLEKNGRWQVYYSDESGSFTSMEYFDYKPTYASVSAGQMFFAKPTGLFVYHFYRENELSSLKLRGFNYSVENVGNMFVLHAEPLEVTQSALYILKNVSANPENFDVRALILSDYSNTDKITHSTIFNTKRNPPCAFVDKVNGVDVNQRIGTSPTCSTYSTGSGDQSFLCFTNPDKYYCMIDVIRRQRKNEERKLIHINGVDRYVYLSIMLCLRVIVISFSWLEISMISYDGEGLYLFLKKSVKLERSARVNVDGKTHFVTHELHIEYIGGSVPKKVACFQLPPGHLYGIVINKEWAEIDDELCKIFRTEPYDGPYRHSKQEVTCIFKTIVSFTVGVIVLDVILTVIMVVIIIIEKKKYRKRRIGMHFHGKNKFGRGRGRHRDTRSEATTEATDATTVGATTVTDVMVEVPDNVPSAKKLHTLRLQ